MRQRTMQMMDVVSLVKAVRNGMAGMDRPSALVVAFLTGAGALVTGLITWVVDWLPTWRFANGEQPADYAYTAATIAETAINSAGAIADGVGGLASLTLGAFIGAWVAIGFTLLPTIIQFVAPRVLHPAARVAMDASVGFDFITDWPSAWAQAGHITAHPIGRFLLTGAFVFLASLFVQTLFVLFLSAFVMSLVILAAGERRAVRGASLEA